MFLVVGQRDEVFERGHRALRRELDKGRCTRHVRLAPAGTDLPFAEVFARGHVVGNLCATPRRPSQTARVRQPQAQAHALRKRQDRGKLSGRGRLVVRLEGRALCLGRI